MPTDPKTGERIPYAGEPGAAPDAPPAPEGDVQVPEGGLVPMRDLKPLMDEADRILAERDSGAPEEPPVDEAPAEDEDAEPVEETAVADDDVAPIAEALDVDTEQAQRLYDAAQTIPMLAGKPTQELAMMLKDDFQLRMRVESAAAQKQDMAAEAMGAEGFSVPDAAAPGGAQ